MRQGWVLAIAGAAVALTGCATLPTGPTVMVLPTPGKAWEQFQGEDYACRQYAAQQVGPPGQQLTENTGTGAVVGTAAGAILGAALGSISGHAGTGAAIGAGTGLLGGAAVGSNADQASGYGAQRRYDAAYQQCMYARGNQIPGVRYQPAAIPSPPPPGYTGPPATSATPPGVAGAPPNYPPPPPPPSSYPPPPPPPPPPAGMPPPPPPR
jgi:hypothetical protein